MLSLAETREELESAQEGINPLELSAQQIKMDERSRLRLDGESYPLSDEGWQQFWRASGCAPELVARLSHSTRAAVFNELFAEQVEAGRVPPKLRITIDRDGLVFGYANADLLDLSSLRLLECVVAALPEDQSAAQITVDRRFFTPSRVGFSCHSPSVTEQPQEGDIVCGGIDVLHTPLEETGIQIKIYLHRLVCENGATLPVKQGERNVRVRRLRRHEHGEEEICEQVRRAVRGAWGQLEERLAALPELLNHPRVSEDFFHQLQRHYALRRWEIDAIMEAMDHDPLGPTGTQYDLFNALSRIATHQPGLSHRNRRRLFDAAGEWSQRHAERCDRCGSWIEASSSGHNHNHDAGCGHEPGPRALPARIEGVSP